MDLPSWDARFDRVEAWLARRLAAADRVHPAVTWARVRIGKPHALRFADSVSVSLEYHAEHPTIVPESQP